MDIPKFEFIYSIEYINPKIKYETADVAKLLNINKPNTDNKKNKFKLSF